jgi:ribosome-associated protein
METPRWLPPLCAARYTARAVALDDLVISPGLSIPAHCLEWSAVRSSGPGGQNVNKVASKVVLRFDFERCPVLAADVRARLRRLSANRLDAEGRLAIASQSERDQPRNLAKALERLASLVRTALTRPRPRKPTRPTAGSRVRRLNDKRHQSQKKSQRSRGDD